jgi:2-phospho-L-lactate guanylyltransferase (CobY/MobA/RfbA family)
MMNKRQLVVLAMLTSVIMAAAPVSALLYSQDQIQATPAEEIAKLADRAEQQVKNLIDLVYANETALQKIEDVGLIDELEGNVTLYEKAWKTWLQLMTRLKLQTTKELLTMQPKR